MENKKMTKKQYFGVLLEIVKGNEDLENFINHEIELLDKKATSGTKTKNQVENESIKEEILNALNEFGRAVSVTELMNKVAYSNQKLSALLKQLVEENKVERVEEKRKVFFKAI